MGNKELQEARVRIGSLYSEAADNFAFVWKQRQDGEGNDQNSREYYAQCYGRRQAIGTVLKEVFGATDHELQRIIDEINKKYDNQ